MPLPTAAPPADAAQESLRARQRRQWLALLAPLLVLAALLAFTLAGERRQLLAAESAHLVQQLAPVRGSLTRQLLAVDRGLAAIVADLPLMDGPDRIARLSRRLVAMEAAMPGVRTLNVLRADGVVLASSRDELIGADFSTRAYFATARESPAGQLQMSAPFRTRLDVWALNLTHTLRTADGSFDGAVSATLDPGFFGLMLESTVGPPDMTARLVHGSGQLLLAVPPMPPGDGIDLAPPGSPLARHRASGAVTGSYRGSIVGIDGQRLVAIASLHPTDAAGGAPLMLALSRDEGAVLAPWRRDATLAGLALALVSALAAAGLAWNQRAERRSFEAAAQARDALAASEWRFRRMFETSIDAIFLTRPDGSVIAANPAAQTMFGLSEAELIARGRAGLVDRDDPRVATLVAQRSDSGSARGEITMLRGDGSRFEAELSSAMFVDPQGGVQGTVSVRDVTGRVRNERALREVRARFEQATRHAGIGVWEEHVTSGGRSWNEAMFRLFEREPADRPPRVAEIHDLVVEPSGTELVADFRRTLADPARSTWNGVFRVATRDGSPRWVRLQCAIERDAQGRALRSVGTAVDLSAQMALDAERAARQQAQARDEAKTAFLSRMSHELRTPLNAMLGYAQLLSADPVLPPAAADRARHISTAGWHLLALINDVLDLSRIEGGVFEVACEPVPLRAAVEQALAMIDAAARERGIALHAEGVEGLGVLADATRLRQVLANLASNAVKYNRDGGWVRVSARAGAAGEVLVEVADSGPGFTPAQQAHVFEPFNRLGREGSGIEGTGIGLSLSRALVERMGGRIALAPPVAGSGACFVLSLPAAPAERDARAAGRPTQPAALSPAEPASAARQVLCVEDNEVNALMLRQLLATLRPLWQVRMAATGAQALKAIAERRPDLLLLDLNLPDMTGLEVWTRATALGQTRGTEVLMLTADATEQAQQQARAVGIERLLVKPFLFGDFERALTELEAV